MQVLGFEAGKNEIDDSRLGGHLKSLLQVKNLVVLSGAGSSILKDDVGKDLGGLTMNAMVENIKKYPDFTSAIKEAKDVDKGIIAKIQSSTDLEQLLTELDSIVASRKIMSTTDFNQLLAIQKSILKYMHEVCTIDGSGKKFPHEIFLKKLLVSRKLSSPRIKVFTLNYDTLFEQAAQNLEAITIDGFSFSQPRKFQGGNFDLDIVRRNHNRLNKDESYYSNVLHLYKLHGSVDWRIDKERIEQVDSGLISPEETVMIYPGSHKYQESYNMPFYELISRFQTALREPNTSLLVIGYSFGDEHINRIILEAIGSNLNLNVYIVSRSAAKSSESNSDVLQKIQEKVKNNDLKNVFMVSTTFKDFTDTLPYFGGGSTYELEQTNKNIDAELEIIDGTSDETPKSNI